MVNIEILRENHHEVVQNNKLIFKTQQRFKSEKHNVFTEEIHKIVLSSNYDKAIQSVDLVEAYTYGTRKDLICKSEKTKYNNIIKQCTHIECW